MIQKSGLYSEEDRYQGKELTSVSQYLCPNVFFFFSDKKGLVLHRSVVIGWDNRSENPFPIPVGGASHIGVSLDKLQLNMVRALATNIISYTFWELALARYGQNIVLKTNK